MSTKSAICPGCRERPRATRQRWCPHCASIANVTLSRPECDAVAQVVRTYCQFSPQYLPAEEAQVVAFASSRLDERKHPTVRERLALGTLIYCWCLAMDRMDLQDFHAEMAYRKLMGHDRRTMTPAPFPPITPVPVPQQLHISSKPL